MFQQNMGIKMDIRNSAGANVNAQVAMIGLGAGSFVT
jgi:hypothetical protein